MPELKTCAMFVDRVRVGDLYARERRCTRRPKTSVLPSAEIKGSCVLGIKLGSSVRAVR